jgi:sugar (pentulose or hexulose) kinase
MDICRISLMWEVPPPAEMVAQVLKCMGKWTWRPERVVWVAGGGDSVAGGAIAAGVVLAAGLQTVFLKSALLNM